MCQKELIPNQQLNLIPHPPPPSLSLCGTKSQVRIHQEGKFPGDIINGRSRTSGTKIPPDEGYPQLAQGRKFRSREETSSGRGKWLNDRSNKGRLGVVGVYH